MSSIKRHQLSRFRLIILNIYILAEWIECLVFVAYDSIPLVDNFVVSLITQRWAIKVAKFLPQNLITSFILRELLVSPQDVEVLLS